MLSLRVKTIKLFRHRKGSDHKLWKRKWVFLRLQRRGQTTLKKLFHALITIKPKSVEPERTFSDTGLFVTKLRNRLNDESVLWSSCISIIKIIEKILSVINNSLINCAGNNSNNFTIILSFIAQNRIHFKTRKKRALPGFFSQLPETRVLKFCPNWKHYFWVTHSLLVVLVQRKLKFTWNSKIAATRRTKMLRFYRGLGLLNKSSRNFGIRSFALRPKPWRSQLYIIAYPNGLVSETRIPE